MREIPVTPEEEEAFRELERRVPGAYTLGGPIRKNHVEDGVTIIDEVEVERTVNCSCPDPYGVCPRCDHEWWCGALSESCPLCPHRRAP